MAPSSKLDLSQVDPARKYTAAENEKLARNLVALTLAAQRGGFGDRPVDVVLLCEMHGQLFTGVRDHAGKHRDRGFGSEFLSYGPNRSADRAAVARSLKELFSAFETTVRRLADSRGSNTFDLDALAAALKLHADVIRIHPFEDGNGRTTRALLDLVLVRFGLPPIAFEIPRQEYMDCLNAYFRSGDLQPLIDLGLELLAGRS